MPPKARRSSERVRIGVVGLGYWGPNLVRNLAESPAFDVASLCDVRAQAMEPLSGRYPALACTTHYEELLRDPAIEAVDTGLDSLLACEGSTGSRQACLRREAAGRFL